MTVLANVKTKELLFFQNISLNDAYVRDKRIRLTANFSQSKTYLKRITKIPSFLWDKELFQLFFFPDTEIQKWFVQTWIESSYPPALCDQNQIIQTDLCVLELYVNTNIRQGVDSWNLGGKRSGGGFLINGKDALVNGRLQMANSTSLKWTYHEGVLHLTASYSLCCSISQREAKWSKFAFILCNLNSMLLSIFHHDCLPSIAIPTFHNLLYKLLL